MTRSSSLPHRAVVQSAALLLAAEGMANEAIAPGEPPRGRDPVGVFGAHSQPCSVSTLQIRADPEPVPVGVDEGDHLGDWRSSSAPEWGCRLEDLVRCAELLDLPLEPYPRAHSSVVSPGRSRRRSRPGGPTDAASRGSISTASPRSTRSPSTAPGATRRAVTDPGRLTFVFSNVGYSSESWFPDLVSRGFKRSMSGARCRQRARTSCRRSPRGSSPPPSARPRGHRHHQPDGQLLQAAGAGSERPPT